MIRNIVLEWSTQLLLVIILFLKNNSWVTGLSFLILIAKTSDGMCLNET